MNAERATVAPAARPARGARRGRRAGTRPGRRKTRSSLWRRLQLWSRADQFDQAPLGLGVRWHEHLEADARAGSKPRVGHLEVKNADDRVAKCPGLQILDLCDCVMAPQ